MTEKTNDSKTETGFRRFSLSQAVIRSLEEMNYTTPTEVQEQAIPRVFAGRDLIVQSRTGTGKTAAYGVPLVELVDPAMLIVQSLVLTPTRELAVQVERELSQIGKDREIRCLTVYGGDSLERQIEGIREGAQVVVGTPGRILDHLRRRTLSFSSVKLLVLDEADRMLDMGFYKEMKQIFDHLPTERQTLMFSATFPKEIDALAYNYLNDPERILLSQDYVYVKEVEHIYYISNRMDKERNLYKLILWEEPFSSMIFCNTREEVRMVFNYLLKRGLAVEMLSSDLPQNKRERVMDRFRRHEVRFLVTTDVAARGIDIMDMSHVFIFSTPSSPDQYVHRAGRTGRIGKSGKAITLLGATDLINFNRLVKANELDVREGDFPTDAEFQAKIRKNRIDQLIQEASTLSPEKRGEYEDLARAILVREDARVPVVAMLLKYSLEREQQAVVRRSESAGSAAPPPRRGSWREGRPRPPRRPGKGPTEITASASRAAEGAGGEKKEGGGSGKRRRRRRRRGPSEGKPTGTSSPE